MRGGQKPQTGPYPTPSTRDGHKSTNSYTYKVWSYWLQIRRLEANISRTWNQTWIKETEERRHSTAHTSGVTEVVPRIILIYASQHDQTSQQKSPTNSTQRKTKKAERTKILRVNKKWNKPKTKISITTCDTSRCIWPIQWKHLIWKGMANEPHSVMWTGNGCWQVYGYES